METPEERGRRLGRKYTLVVFGLLAAGFTVLSTQQLTFAVFGLDAAQVSAAPPSASAASLGGGCAARLRGMAAAVERAIQTASRAENEARAATEFRSALSPEWNDATGAPAATGGPPEVVASCAAEAHGTDALSTVVRLRVAGEQVARRHVTELAPLRRDVAIYLP